jgi:hypothetical protein
MVQQSKTWCENPGLPRCLNKLAVAVKNLPSAMPPIGRAQPLTIQPVGPYLGTVSVMRLSGGTGPNSVYDGLGESSVCACILQTWSRGLHMVGCVPLTV